MIVSKYRRLLILYFLLIINDLSLLPIHFRFLYKSTIGKVVNFFISIFLYLPLNIFHRSMYYYNIFQIKKYSIYN